MTVADHIAFLGGFLPSGGVDLIKTQLQSLAAQNEAALSFGFIFGLALALWSANNGIKTLFEAMNIAYDETEKRSFVRLNLISLGFTLGAIVIGILFIVERRRGAGRARLRRARPASPRSSSRCFAGRSSSSPQPSAFPCSTATARAGERAKWRWVTWGSVVATALWLLASILFSWYLQNFADYNATYGSLGAVIGFMMWTWISVVIVILGAELNSEMEHQTARDSTTGPEAADGRARRHHGRHARRKPRRPAAQAGARRAEREPMRFGGENEGMHRTMPEQRPSRLGTALGFALPLAAIGLRVLLDQRAKSQSGRARDARGPVPSHPASVATPRRRHTASRTRRAGSAFGDYLREIDLSGFLARLGQLMAGSVRRIRARLS